MCSHLSRWGWGRGQIYGLISLKIAPQQLGSASLMACTHTHTHIQAKSAPQTLMHAQVETQSLTPKHQAPKCHRHQTTEQQNEPIV